MRNLTLKTLALSTAFMVAGAGWASGQDFDDIYFDPSKAPKLPKKEKKSSAEAESQTYYYINNGEDYPPADIFTPQSGGRSNISIDDYNRRGFFATNDSVESDTTAQVSDYTYTKRIQRFYNPEVANADAVIAEYLASPSANVNIIVGNPYPYSYNRWGYPYYSSYWDPFYPGYGWGRYPYYDPWYWNTAYWGPSWSWSYWGPSWSWGWGPGYWGPSWSWGWTPSYRPSYPGNNHRPNYGGGSRPTTGQRPGSGVRPGTSGNHRPTADGYRPGSGIYPGTSGNGTRPSTSSGSGYYRPGANSGNNQYNNGSYTRPGRNDNNNSGSSYSRPGSSSSRGSGYSGGSRGGNSGNRGGGSGSRGGGGRH